VVVHRFVLIIKLDISVESAVVQHSVFMEKINISAAPVAAQESVSIIKLNISVKTVVVHKFANIINIKITAKNVVEPLVANPPGVPQFLPIQPMTGSVWFVTFISFQRNLLSVIIKLKSVRLPIL
jgi:hypothetical protein